MGEKRIVYTTAAMRNLNGSDDLKVLVIDESE
jgi:hypothetical protein